MATVRIVNKFWMGLDTLPGLRDNIGWQRLSSLQLHTVLQWHTKSCENAKPYADQIKYKGFVDCSVLHYINKDDEFQLQEMTRA